MGNLISIDYALPNHNNDDKKKTTQPVPDFSGKGLDWPIYKTKIKASLRTSNTIDVIETPGHQDLTESIDDKVHVFGIL